jgi:hypothetical protein
VLGVDWNDLPRPGDRRPDEGAAGHERLLVGQGEGTPGAQRRERRREAEGAHDAVEHDLARPGGELGHRVRAGEDLRDPEVARAVAASRCLGVERQLQILCGARLGHADDLDPQLERLGGEQPDVAAAGAQPDDPKPVRVAAHDVDGLRADGAGGAEQHDGAG